VAGGQDYEIDYEKNKLKVSSGEVKKAVQAVGNSRNKIEKKLKK
jgi:predicted Ser/Thr protein kinase